MSYFCNVCSRHVPQNKPYKTLKNMSSSSQKHCLTMLNLKHEHIKKLIDLSKIQAVNKTHRGNNLIYIISFYK